MKTSKTKKFNKGGACKAVYDRYYYLIWRTDKYYCVLHEKIAERDGGCEDWSLREKVETIYVERLDSAAHDVELLKVYLKDL